MAGDSTMANKKPEKFPETGWGMKIPQFFNENTRFENHAKNGRSTRTFIEEGRWDSLISKLKADDIVFIQFGHNDQSKHKVDRYTSPKDYYRNLCRFVDDVHVKEAIPILFTPVMRRRFNKNSVFYDVHGEYPDLVRAVAEEKGVALIDMHKLSEKLLVDYGEQESKKIFLQGAPGELKNYPNGIEDNTHFNERGATETAMLVVRAIKESGISLKKRIKKDVFNH